MNRFESVTRPLMWFMALLLVALAAGCGGGGGGRDPILGLPGLVSIAVTPATNTIPINGIQQFTSTATYADGSSLDVTASSSWASGTTTVATVVPTTGVATGVTNGTSLIMATFGGKTATATLTVTSVTLVSINVTPAPASIPVLGTQQFTATAIYSDGSTSNVTASSNWGSATLGVATVGLNTGLATGVASGTSLITAAFGGKTGSATLTVTAASVVSIMVTPVTASIPVLGTQQFTAIATYDNGSTLNVTANAANNWGSATLGVATVGLNTGLATGVASGTSVITASFGGKTGSATLTVTAASVVSIMVTPVTASIPVLGTQQFTAIATYDNGSTLDVTTNVNNNWGAADVAPGGNVASVGLHTGRATGGAIGQSTITAAFGGKTGTATLTVNGKVLVSFVVMPVTASIPVTGTQQFTATATYDDGSISDETTNGNTVWTSADVAPGFGVATVSSIGVATGNALGQSTITASYHVGPLPYKTGSAVLTVNNGVNLGTASTFGIFARSSAVTLQANSVVNGDVGINLADACNGCVVGTTVFGLIHNGDVAAQHAQIDATAAYNDAANRSTGLCTLAANTEIAGPQGACAGYATPPGTVDIATTFPTYEAGLYWSASTIDLGVGKTIYLDGKGNPDAVFIFQAGSAITTGTNSTIVLTGLAQAKNVYWMAGTATTLGVSSIFKGTVIALGAAVKVLNGTNLQPTLVDGRLISLGAAAEVDTYATVTVPAP